MHEKVSRRIRWAEFDMGRFCLKDFIDFLDDCELI